MKLIDLLSPARRRRRHSDEIHSPGSLADRRTDRSSMAELVRLLQEHDEAQEEGNTSKPRVAKR